MTQSTRLPEPLRAFGGNLTALVTGASSGIGLATARLLVEADIDVWIGARNLERAGQVARELGDRARAVRIDVTDSAAIAAAAETVGALDILVNNAGINPGGEDIQTTTLDQMRRSYETNVFGLVAVTQAFLPALARSAHPRIVNISSGTGSLGWNGGPNPQFDWQRVRGGGIAYRSAKTAVNAITLMTAQALGERFKVNALAPGLRRTNLIPGMTAGGDPTEAAAGVLRLALLPDHGPTGGFWSWDGTSVPW
ncbi:SDR family NAD(P)-dependent oxidoreductase [Curtobacterium ammoniigenes]|uniref:SDR family NAD(P)-dependent oxidoreductase n=1 Tax=Curtobacterium ammoniigenes TaxID=395387 RepID=UPI000832CC1F|nr:SDR family NAD(P)-dependent oxidoreductase [Curtobacterium ammoniigenes]